MKKRKALIKTAAVLTATTMLGVSSVYPGVNIVPGSFIQVQAATIVKEGDCGEVEGTVTYKLDSDGVLTISGSGEMKNYPYDSSGAPWYGNRDSVKKIVIEDGVTSIGDYVFSGCSGLSGIEIPGSVKRIGGYVFEGCSGLSSIEIPGSVKSIGWHAFEGCSGLSSIEIPGSVTCIDFYAFEGCIGLSSIVVEEGNEVYDSRENCNAIISKKYNELIAGCKNTKIPGSVKSIEEGAFSGCSGLSSIEIPGSVKSIAVWAFAGCSGLSSIKIPESVTSIGDDAFRNCSGLSSITVEEGNKAYDSRENCNAIISKKDNELIAGCKNTKIPGSVTSIGYHAFAGCSGLSGIEIPGSVTSIGSYAFAGCSGLSSIKIPESVTSIRGYVFEGCSGLSSIVVEEGNKVYDSRENCNAIISKKDNELIAGCKDTKIPGSVTSIGMDAFSGCSGLSSIEIPESVTSIGSGAFSGCSGLSSIEIPGSVTNIETSAFKGCSGLSSIVVEEGNEVYDSRENCNAIISKKDNKLIAGCKDTKIPESVTSIGYYAFKGCSGLSSIKIPESVTSIGYDAFAGCSGLSSIEIPGSVTNIDTSAFKGCSEDLRIVGETGSYAEKYANKENIQFVDKNHEHIEVIYEVRVEPTCTTEGRTEGSHCSVCNKVIKKQETIPAAGHSFDEGKVTKEPTTKEEGIKTFTCTNCGETKTEKIDKLAVTIPTEGNVWHTDNLGNTYWYEDGVKQGVKYNEDGTVDLAYRGKEIYDPQTDAWYWLDSVLEGQIAKSKDVYQESKAGIFGDNKVYKEDGTIDVDANTGKWVRYDKDGHMVKGWCQGKAEETTQIGSPSEAQQGQPVYYFDKTYGAMAKGYATIDGKEYYFNPDTGILEREVAGGVTADYTGWKDVDGVSYWYENGIRQGYSTDSNYRGKEVYDPASNAWYWLDNIDGGKKAVNKDVYQESKADDAGNIGKWVRYDSEGHMVKGWSDDGRYYFDPVYGTMYKGWHNIDGTDYYFDEATGVRA